MDFGRRDNPEHYARLRDSLSASRRALAAMGVAVSLAVLGASGVPLALIPALIAAIFALVDALLAWRGYNAAEARDLDGLLSGNACQVEQARALEYGVGAEALPDGAVWQYVQRDFESDLREAIDEALRGVGPRLVLLSGETKSGKTRSAFHALGSSELRDAWLVVPKDGASVETLLRPGSLPSRWAPLVVWLDDLERYASVEAGGLREGALRNLECHRPVVLLGTVGGRSGGSVTGAGTLVDPVDQLMALGRCIEVPVRLSQSELNRAESCYGSELIEEIKQVGLGRRMVAMSKLRDELRRPHDDCREGFAIVRALIDWRRAGAQQPLSVDRLGALYWHYLADGLDPGQGAFASGLRWACRQLPDLRVSLVRKASDLTGYEPYDLAVEVACAEWPTPTPQELALIVALADPLDCFQMARTAHDGGNMALALDLLARAERSEDKSLSATSAFNAGVSLAEAGDLEAAESAYRRADTRGSRRGAFNLGQMLRHRGELAEAEMAYRRADERGSAAGAVNLGVMLERRGDLVGAEMAYRRGRQGGSRKGASNLERLRAGRAQRSGSDSVLNRREEPGRATT